MTTYNSKVARSKQIKKACYKSTHYVVHVSKFESYLHSTMILQKRERERKNFVVLLKSNGFDTFFLYFPLQNLIWWQPLYQLLSHAQNFLLSCFYKSQHFRTNFVLSSISYSHTHCLVVSFTPFNSSSLLLRRSSTLEITNQF